MGAADLSSADNDVEIQDDDPTKDEPQSDDASSPGTSRRPSQAPGQKRRRVTRACDECRRKKIKCDGRQPCTHCTVYSYDCTYDQPSHRRRNPGPQYVESLERRLQRAEALLHSIAPHIDLSDSNLDPSSHQSPNIPTIHVSPISRPGIDSPPEDTPTVSETPDHAGLESMIRATGQLDLDEKGHWDYYGHSSGLSFLRRIRDQFGNVLNPEAAGSRSAPMGRPRSLGQDFTSPRSPNQIIDSPFDTIQAGHSDLPPKDLARRLCNDALNDASAILNLLYRPSFDHGFDRIYSITPEESEPQDARFLPLLYSVMALGCLFDKGEGSVLEQSGYESATSQGYRYFNAARSLMDVTDCRDLTSLQAIVYMILFLQCSAKLSTCYSFIGIALRSALRMGLHRSFQDGFSPIEAEVRKRAFWVIRKMDVYVGAMLGLPLPLADDDFDQDMPTEVDDDYITETAILPMPPGSVPLAAASNANFRLAKILNKIVKSVYPIKGNQTMEQNPTRTYSISFATVYELENDLKMWEEQLLAALKPGGAKPSSHIGPISQLLRMAYAHAQMMLYRPFLHYSSPRSRPKDVDQRAYGCAAACISVSRNVIHITATMKKEGLLVGSYWFTMYTAFFAVLSLLYFAVENPDSATSQEVVRDAQLGRETLAQLAKRSMAADRCTTTLTSVFQSLEGTLQKIEARGKNPTGVTSRKREAPSMVSDVRATQSQQDVSEPTGREAPQRANTYPLNANPKPQRADALRSQIRPKKSPQTSRKAQAKVGTGAISSSAAAPPERSKHSPKSSIEAFKHSSTPQQQAQMQHVQRPSLQQAQQQMQQQPQSQQTQTQTQLGQQGHHQHPQVHHHHQQQQQQQSSHEHSYHQQVQQQQQQQMLPHHHPYLAHQAHQVQGLNHADNLTDLSAMMFPSTDPFAYPNPPITTLEQQNYSFVHGLPLSQSGPSDLGLQHDGSGNYMSGVARDFQGNGSEHVDVQLFGPLPPYLLQSSGSSTGYHHAQQQLGMERGGGDGQGAMRGGAQMWAEQTRGPGLEHFNYEDVFGNEEEWRRAF